MFTMKSSSRIFLGLLLLCVILASYIIQLRLKSSMDHGKGITTIILVWYWPFQQTMQLNPDTCETFGISNCLLVDNRSWLPKADFVVFHNRELVLGIQTLPTDRPRPQHQRWVWFSLESPAHNGNLRRFDGYFNYTMSYTRDADFYSPYGKIVPKSLEKGKTVYDFIPKKKSSLVCWVVSNFSPNHRRTSVYNKLKNVIQVDVYGRVGKPVSESDLLATISGCYFYLSFENSEFKDYITEKFWRNALLAGAVPVVLGPPRAHYEAVAPKGSFIHVDDFGSVEELGKFLKDLAEDRKRYASYFAWHLNYDVQEGGKWDSRMCSICSTAGRVQRQQVYKNLQAWEEKENYI